jgi:hypothetical protein
MVEKKVVLTRQEIYRAMCDFETEAEVESD